MLGLVSTPTSPQNGKILPLAPKHHLSQGVLAETQEGGGSYRAGGPSGADQLLLFLLPAPIPN